MEFKWLFVKDIGWTKVTGEDPVLMRIYGEPLSYPKGQEIHFGRQDIEEIEGAKN